MKLAIIVAIAENRVIGKDGKIPWAGRLPTDMERFVNLTTGHPVIMGRKTYESIPPKFRPLADRLNIVLSRHGGRSETLITDLSKGVVIATDLDAAIAEASLNNPNIAFFAGGAEIYRQILPLAHLIYLTQIHAEVKGDAFFPEIDHQKWRCESEEGPFRGFSDQYSFSFITYTRV